MPEVRVLLEGSYALAGVKWDLVKGETFGNKMEYLLTDVGANDFVAKLSVEGQGASSAGVPLSSHLALGSDRV